MTIKQSKFVCIGIFKENVSVFLVIYILESIQLNKESINISLFQMKNLDKTFFRINILFLFIFLKESFKVIINYILFISYKNILNIQIITLRKYFWILFFEDAKKLCIFIVILGNKRHFVLKIFNKNDYIIFSRLFFIMI